MGIWRRVGRETMGELEGGGPGLGARHKEASADRGLDVKDFSKQQKAGDAQQCKRSDVQ